MKHPCYVMFLEEGESARLFLHRGELENQTQYVSKLPCVCTQSPCVDGLRIFVNYMWKCAKQELLLFPLYSNALVLFPSPFLMVELGSVFAFVLCAEWQLVPLKCY